MFARRLFDFPSVGWRHPFADFDRLSRQMDQLTRRAMGRPGLAWQPARVFPAINLTEDKDNLYVRAELPGFKAEALEISVTGKDLTITGERKTSAEGENIRYHRKERDSGKFSRIIGLPGDVDADNVTAKMVNGILTVTIAKAEKAKPRQITIN